MNTVSATLRPCIIYTAVMQCICTVLSKISIETLVQVIIQVTDTPLYYRDGVEINFDSWLYGG